MSLLAKARELGQALTETQEYNAMRAAESAAYADEEASDMLEQWSRMRDDFVGAMSKRGERAEEVAEAMRSLKEAMEQNPRISAMEESRAAFSHVIDQVNAVLRFMVTGESSPDEGDEEEHSCEGCGGCSGGCYLH